MIRTRRQAMRIFWGLLTQPSEYATQYISVSEIAYRKRSPSEVLVDARPIGAESGGE